jgi:hypothetical protein
MSDSSIPVDQPSAIKLRQTEEMLLAFQEQSEMYRTMKSCLCDCSNCISARVRKAGEGPVSARRIPTDIPKQLKS